MKTLAVIPARAGSKGIPRKNVRLMHGKPLIAYCLQNARLCNEISDVVVTTDDAEVMAIAKIYGVNVIARKPELAEDHVTLDPVICDAVVQMEQIKGYAYDIVVTLQATSPLLKSQTLCQAIRDFREDNKDTYISVTNQAHLSWGKGEEGFYPHYSERLNRQQLPPNYVETGAFHITMRKFVTECNRIGNKVSVYEVDSVEAIDIDTVQDWVVCEQEFQKKKIVFRADGYKALGMGHIYHCLTLAYHMTGHEIMFVTNKNFHEGYEKLKDSFLPVHTIEKDADFYEFLENSRPDIVVNDCLNTTKEYVLKIKSLVKKVVTIEDLGEGALYADAVINALYPIGSPYPNHYVGAKYACLRDEFLIQAPKPFSEQVNNLLVMFGGTDPLDLTRRIYRMAEKCRLENPRMEIHFVIGNGYCLHNKEIRSREKENIYVHSDIANVAEYMAQADLAFTSQGRTVFELATMGVPAIVLAQNEREQMHTFAQMEHGFLNLGLGSSVSEDTILSTFHWLVHTPQIRKEMRELMLKERLGEGTKRVIDVILKDA